MKDRVCWFFKVWDEADPTIAGIGECAPLPGLSAELSEDFEDKLQQFVDQFNKDDVTEIPASLEATHQVIRKYPDSIATSASVVFALESAFLDLAAGGKRWLYNNSFVAGTPIPINGLIWMGGMDFMLQQIEIKIRDGFRCIKIKVGGLDFERECDILQYVRRKYFRDKITIRLDANGSLKPEDSLYKLKEFSKFDIHSVEQPLKPGSELLPELCIKSPIPIALDEELINISGKEQRSKLLAHIKPQFIILKPTLHGGLLSCQEWIQLAEQNKAGWWITSALESNIGLNAIAQFASNYHLTLPQGLGTGALYDDNFQSPLEIRNDGSLWYNPRETWDLPDVN